MYWAPTSLYFLVLGLIAVLSRKGIDLGSGYIKVDLNFLIGSLTNARSDHDGR